MHLKVAYSPDTDDAFMFWALQTNRLSSPFTFSFTPLDTESLNQEALKATYDICAVSIGLLSKINHNYRLLPHGGSVGQNYGPVVVSHDPQLINWTRQTVAIPGENTTAALILRLLHPRVKTIEVPITPFSEAFDCLKDGRAQASLLIHEGRLTYEKESCFLLEDLGQAWYQKTRLPLPLGGNVIRRNLPEKAQHQLNHLLWQSIQEALNHRQEAINWLLTQNLGNLKTSQEIDAYLNLYANDDTAAYSQKVYQSIEEVLRQGHDAGLLPQSLSRPEIEDAFWQLSFKQ